MVGVVGIIILAAVIQQGKANYLNLSGLPVFQKEISNKTRAVPVDGPEGDVPQKLLKELKGSPSANREQKQEKSAGDKK